MKHSGDMMKTGDHYCIHVEGHLDIRWLRWFEGLTVEQLDNEKTRISGYMIDQSALFGVLNRIRDLGLVLISVEKGMANADSKDSQN